jgi:hypothetical protein
MNRSLDLHMGSTTRFFRVIGISLIALLALASGRSLVPGLCATQAALNENGEQLAVCCDHSPYQPAEGSPSINAETEVACAFCSLATTLVTASPGIVFESISAPAPAGRILADSNNLPHVIDRTHAGRAPPMPFAA